MEKRLQQTADGSHTIFVPELNEHYHSVNGAIEESRHVFIRAGFEHCVKPGEKINLLEVGFGTGLNALLTCIAAQKTNVQVNYVGIEAYPLPDEIINALNYPQATDELQAELLFKKIHDANWVYPSYITERFLLNKIEAMLQDVSLSAGMFNLIYFDAFSPEVQPELWTDDILRKLYAALAADGILVTYSSKGTVKQALRKAGFTIERLRGAAGKRHMLRAIKNV
ncbi:MAG TPA: tRNA (5-methylaminomethyl-2-thiouridine)(34)-methyltransferase MnmD [Bacteroidales bacterium]|nr:tRNA (5-methylaminomethyl-2-thiouridine)(34)-methyltransferase MnmD [Bacteroidales bacterium]